MNRLDQIKVITGVQYMAFGMQDAESHLNDLCPWCSTKALVLIAYEPVQGSWGEVLPPVDGHGWVRCLSCGRPSVWTRGALWPASVLFGEIEGLTGAAADAWDEARACFSIGAYSSSALMCRKLLFHIAVHEGLPATKGDGGRAPNFTEAVDYLVNEGVISKKMKPWAEKIRNVGNAATHELPATSKVEAERVITLVEHLLSNTYEMEAVMGRQLEGADED